MAQSDEFDSLSSSAVPGVDATTPDGTARDNGETGTAAELERVKAEAQAQRELYLRALADFDNYKKRTERFVREQSDAGRRTLLVRVLNVLDNLERAAAFREQGTSAESLVDGLLATIKQFNQLLEAEGVRPIDVTGKTFDPKVSEAVGTRVAQDTAPNVVLDQARRGYMIGDDVLRPAQVIVSKEAE